jgi:hypothetical protein
MLNSHEPKHHYDSPIGMQTWQIPERTPMITYPFPKYIVIINKLINLYIDFASKDYYNGKRLVETPRVASTVKPAN